MNQSKTISLSDTEEVKCPCGHNYFQEFITMRRVSALVTGTGKDEYIPHPVLVCVKCEVRFERPKLIK